MGLKQIALNVVAKPAGFAHVVAQLLGICFQEERAHIRCPFDFVQESIEVTQGFVALYAFAWRGLRDGGSSPLKPLPSMLEQLWLG